MPDNIVKDPPPPYEEAIQDNLVSDQVTTKGDGRVDLDLDSFNYKFLRFSAPNPPNAPKHLDQQDGPPVLDTKPGEPFPVVLNIVIQVVGSRGDVQPFLALGRELQKHGHRVRLATHNTFASFVRDASIEFYPIGGDPAELMAYMVRNPGLIPSMESLRAGDIKRKRAMMADILRGCWDSCIRPDPVSQEPFVADAIIANPPSFAHVHCAQALSIPLHIMFTMPWTSTASFTHPLVNLKLGDKNLGAESLAAANMISYAVVDFLTWQGLGHVINEWRDSLDLEPIAFSEGPNLLNTLKVPVTYCWSPSLVPKPDDWPSHIDICGFFFREPPKYTPSEKLDLFLRSGAPPIYIGFGSIVVEDPQSLSAMLLEAVRVTGVRALISRGWAGLDGPDGDDVMFLGDCPHEWLFQHVRAVMHHGGAGTTACGLLHGKPTAIIPFFGDQSFWGTMVAAAGAGPDPIPQKLLSVDRLVQAIQVCLAPESTKAASTLGETMRRESGIEQAVASFHAHLPPREALQCDIIKGQPAVWTYSTGKTRLKLSKIAASILAKRLKVDMTSLQRYETRRFTTNTRRWDPFSGTVAAALDVTQDLYKGVAGAVVTRPKKAALTQENENSNVIKEGALGVQAPLPRQSQQQKVGGGSTLPILTAVTRTVVTVPLAFVEGFRRLPLLCGGGDGDEDQPRDYGEVRDWKSGLTVGGKATVFGLYDGITGVVMLPYRVTKNGGGAMEAVKGVGKGVTGAVGGAMVAALGMPVYSLYGIHKTVMHAVRSGTRKSVEMALRDEGKYRMERDKGLDGAGWSDQAVVDRFDLVKRGRNIA